MTVWKKLDKDKCYAVAICNFTGTSQHHLALEIGELVVVEQECRLWYHGHSLRREAAGIFPKSYVRVRDCIVHESGGTVAASCGGGGVAHDIALTLRDWLQHWKQLYLNNGEAFKFMEVSMNALLKLRAQACTAALPQDQLRKLRCTAVFTIDRGNKALGMELTVRDQTLQLVDSMQISASKLNTLHQETETRISKNMEPRDGSNRSSTISAAPRCYSVLVSIKNFVCKMSEEAELLVTLYDGTALQQLTEHYAVRWARHGLPHNVDHVNHMNVLFTELGLADIKMEKMYLVCFVVRLGAMEPQNMDNRRSSVATVNNNPRSSTGTMRRPFGVACADITRALAATASTAALDEKQHCIPFYPCEKESLDSLLRKIISNRELKPDTKNTQGLWISLKLLHGDFKQIREESPHLMVGNVSISPKIGFPEVIVPGVARNDLYVRLVSGSFTRGGGKPSERNLELSARLLDAQGRVIPNAISMGAGLPLMNEYSSLVYYHDDKPRWQEVFKVCLSTEQFKDAHLVIMCRHRSSNEAKDKAEKNFALAYLRLMRLDGTTTHDAEHNLCVYKLDTKRFPGSEGSAAAARACLGVPARREELPPGAERGLTRGPLALSPRDALFVATHLCSTKLTYREEILGVLKWSTHLAEGTLRESLRRLLVVPSEEIVKFLQDILDAIFNILTQVEESELYLGEEEQPQSIGALALACLLKVTSLVSDHKYQDFQPLLDVYIDTSFCNTLAYERLLSLVRGMVVLAESSEAAQRRLLQCMKCLEYLVRFIVRSRELRAELGDTTATNRFNEQFSEFLSSLVWLMRCGESTLLCQGSCLKYLPHAVPHILRVYPAEETSEMVVRLLSALPMSKLSTQRILCLQELARGPLCTSPACRRRLLPHLATTIHALVHEHTELRWSRPAPSVVQNAGGEARGKSRSVEKVARVLGTERRHLEEYNRLDDLLELCISTLGEVLSLLQRTDVGDTRADRGVIARTLLRTILRATSACEKERQPNDTLLRQLVSALLDILRLTSAEQYRAAVKSMGSEAREFLSDALALINALLVRPVYPSHWADMLHLQAHTLIHTLELASSSLVEAPAERRLWRAWFRCGVTAATHAAVQPAALSAAARLRLRARHGDLRRRAAELLHRMWFQAENKRYLIPCLVGGLLEVSLLPDEEVRISTIPIFFDMMQTEFHDRDDAPPGATINGHFDKFENEMIDKLDVLVEGGSGDAEWRACFVSLVGALCAAHPLPALQASGLALVAAVGRQLDTLLEYRQAAHHALSHRMLVTTRVLSLYDNIDRRHMYIRYVHKLVEMHAQCRQWAEAGLALKLHAELLAWSDEPLHERLRPPNDKHASAATHRQLKEALYLDIVEYLHKGKMWELAVEVVKALVLVFEQEALGYRPLMEMHGQLQRLYRAALLTARAPPGYFRLRHHGRVHPHLRAPHGFVYRGEECELLPDFCARMLAEWPDAELLNTLDTPSEEITEADAHYLQINAVEPVMGSNMKQLSGRAVPDEILQHYKHNNVNKFIFSRPIIKHDDDVEGEPQNEFASRWLERTELEISHQLPGILRWFPVTSVNTFLLSPLEVALETMRETNSQLLHLILRHKQRDDVPLDPLTRKIHGIVDAAVMGGIVNYERAFLSEAYAARHGSEHAAPLQELRALIAEQAPLLEAALDVHAARAPQALRALHQHLAERFQLMRAHVHKHYGRKSLSLPCELPEVNLRRSALLHADEEPVDTDQNRLSDLTNGAPKRTLFTSLNQFTRYSSSPGGGTTTSVLQFGTMQSPAKRRDKRRARRSEIGTSTPTASSQWYTNNNTTSNNNLNTSTTTINNNTASYHGSSSSLNTADTPTQSPLRELRQELSATRPLRAEAERERRLSQRASLHSAPPSNRNSIGTTDSTPSEEDPIPAPPPPPPPLPLKTIRLDVNKSPMEEPTTRYRYDTVMPAMAPRGSFLYTSLQNRHKMNNNVNNNNNNHDDRAPTPPPKKKHNI